MAQFSYRDMLQQLESRKKGQEGVHDAVQSAKAAKLTEGLLDQIDTASQSGQKSRAKGELVMALATGRARLPEASAQEPQAQRSFSEMAEEAQRELDTYLKSDTYRQNQTASYRRNLLSMAAAGASIGEAPITNLQTPDPKEQELRAKVSFFREEARKEADQAVMDADMTIFEAWPEEDRVKLRVYNEVGMGSFNAILGAVSGDAQAKAYLGYQELVDKYGVDTVSRMAESVSRFDNQTMTESARELSGTVPDGFAGGAGGFAAARTMNLMGNITAPIGLLTNITRPGSGRYSTMDPNNPGNLPNVIGSGMDERIVEHIRDAESGQETTVGKEVLGTVYRAGASAADSLLRIYAGGGNKLASQTLIAAGSFGRAVNEYSAQGASPYQALLMGTFDAGLEVLTEEVSLDRIIHQAQYAPDGFMDWLKNAAISGGIEVSEEELSFVGSTILQAVVMGDRSSHNQQIGQAVAQGMDYTQAKALADLNWLKEGAATAVESFLSGGMMSGAAGMDSAQNARRLGKNLEKGSIGQEQAREVMELARKTAPDSPAAELARAFEKKYGGKNISAYDRGRLYQAAMQEGTGSFSQILEKQFADGFKRQMGLEPEAETSSDGEAASAAQNPEADFSGERTKGYNPNAGGELEPAAKDSLERLARFTGRRMEFFAVDATEEGMKNGFYQDGTIFINVRSGDPKVQIFSHELTHSTETADCYGDLRKLVLGRIQQRGSDIAQLREDKIALYERNGVTLDVDGAEKEIVAQYVADHLLTNEESILSLVQEDRSLGERIRSWLDGLLARLGNENAQERIFIRRARDLYARALDQTRQKPGENQNSAPSPEGFSWDSFREAVEADLDAGKITQEEYDQMMDYADSQEVEDGKQPAERQYSFGGVNARSADMDKLETAKDLEAQEVAMETIRQQTGWFRGRDGKWRFEIDDSTARVADEVTNYMKLGDLLKDARILEEYPDLREMEVVFQSLEPGVSASYNPQFDCMDVSYLLKGDPEAIRGAVLHEIQHAVQAREGFTGGTSVKTWERRIKEGFDSRRGEDIRESAETERRIAEIREKDPEFYREMMELDAMAPDLPRGEVDWDTLELITEDPPEWKAYDARREELEEKYGEEKVWDFNGLIYEQERNAKIRGRTATELYLDTAGEIEARNVAGRRNLTAEERKKTPPILGGEDTVFADERNLAGMQFSMAEISGEKADYGKGVILDTDLFDGVKPRYWRKVLEPYVYKHFAGRAITVYDGEGNPETVYFAREKDRVRKDGAKNSHPVLGELTRVSGNAQSLAVVHLPELLETSILGNRSEDNTHGWLDQNGWEYRKVYMEDINGNIYEATLNIADGRDRKILYSVSLVKKIDKKRTTGGVVPSDQNGRGSLTTSSSTERVSQPEDEVKSQFSISPAEGQQTTDQRTEENPEEAPERKSLTPKARNYLEGQERQFLRDLGDKLYVPRIVRREWLRPIVQRVSNAYLRDGRLDADTAEALFEEAYAKGIIVDAEFYHQYKPIRDHLRTTGVTLSKQDQADIADFADFKKRASSRLRIQEEGGLPVDVAYQELNGMAPELFPERITHPADQLQHMLDVAMSIQISEKTIREYFGDSAKEFRTWARGEFDSMIGTMGRELQKVRRFAEEQTAKIAVPESPATVEEVKEAFLVLKEKRRELEKIQRKHLLTQSDEEQVSRLLKGKILPEDLDPDKDNVEGILAVYEGKKGYEQQAKLIGQYRQHLRGKMRQQADSFLETAAQWKDKATGLAYSRETMHRNLMDIIRDKNLAQGIYDTYFGTVHTAEAEATRFKTDMRDRVRALELSTKPNKGDLVSESHAVQLYGEAMDNIAMIRASRGRMKVRDGKTEQQWQAVIQDMFDQSPGIDRGKIERATEEFRKIYDELFERMNEVRIANGYEPINYRRGYFPHFQPGDEGGLLQQFGRSLGLDTQVSALPTTINGLTHTFRPGIQWFGNAQERLGFNTAYDALEGFDKYIEGAAGVIFHTENIQKLRALEAQIRYRTSPEGIRRQVDAVYADDRLTDEEKRMKVEDIYKNGQFTLSNFCNELTEYTNLLAGKKSRLDRTVESLMGRRIYTIMKNLESRVGANMVGANLGSALTNFIPLTQAGAQLDRGMIVKGMWDTLRSYREDDGIIGASSFLTNRQGSDTLVKTWTQRASQVAGKPMEWIDGFVSGSIVRAAYQQNLKEGLSEAEAMYQADLFAAGVMGDRSRGAMPTLFESRNPLLKAFTQFQLEVNNQFSEVFKDLPRRYREKGAGVLAGVLLKYFLGAFLYNEVFEYLFGRRPAMDPIGILNDTTGDWLGYELPNLVEWGKNAVTGEETSLKTESVGFGQAVANMGTEVVGQLPFSSGLALLGVETDGGRIPISSAIPDFRAVWDAVSAKDWSGKKRWYEIQQELNKLAYVLPPFGGGQISKSWKGIKAFLEGGSYSVNNAGEDILQYPIFREEDGITAFMQAALMGKSSLASAQGWVESGFDSLSAKQTAIYQDLTDAGIGQKEAFTLIRDLETITKTDSQSKAELQRERLMQENPEVAAIVYYGLLADDKTRELMDAMTDEGAGAGEVAKALMGIQNAGNTAQKREAVMLAGLTDEEKHLLYREKISDGKEDEIAQLRAAGLSFDDFLRIQNRYSDINDSELKATEKARQFSHWVNGQKFTQRQKDAIKESFTYYSMVPATAEKYDRLVAAGISEQAAFELVEKLEGLKPAPGKKTVDDLQKYRVVVDSGMTEARQMQALQTVIGEGLYDRVSICQSNGVTPSQYLAFRALLPQYDANGNGSLSQKEVQAALDSMGSSDSETPVTILLGRRSSGEGLTNAQKAVIWQSYNKTWKASKNPYDKAIGKKVYALMNEEEAGPAVSQSSGDFGEELLRQLLDGMK